MRAGERNHFFRAEGIQKSYIMGRNDELPVLKGIDLEMNPGEIIAVTGPSGVGKSTLLHIMGGLDRPTKGRVTVNGVSVFSMSDQKLANFRNETIGFVFQFHHLLPEFTALENVAMPALISRKPARSVFRDAERYLEEVGLGHRMKHKPQEMSGGEQQRVAFARSLINDPLIVLADEPSGNLDLKRSRGLHELMWDLVKQKKKTFVVVTHNLELAGQADRIIQLYDGRIKN
jgi:lipoprotein-releasing system ATP-binding protein